jgi:predicted porin
MQKKLIALAVAGMFAAPAFAATSNVDVYGILSMSVDYADSDNGNDDSDVVTAKSNASRIGFKGSEDLGGGLSAVWQIESEILKGTNNNGTGWNDMRNTFVGLKGGFGTVLMGRHDTPYKMGTGKLDPFADTVGDYNAIIGATDQVGASSMYDLRVDQTIAYISPTFSGFHAGVAYVGLKNVEGSGDNQDAWSVTAIYDQGPLFASVSWEQHNGGVAGSTGSEDSDAWKVGLGYTFGNTTLNAIYESIDAASDQNTRDAWYISGVHKMGNITLKAAYGQADDSDRSWGDDDGAQFWAIGADYSLSKRTTLYAVYATVDNENWGDYGLFGQGNPSATGANSCSMGSDCDPSTFSVGIKHSF